MKGRIPSDAFEYYVGQGDHRSYQATADHFGVSKAAIVKCAKREEWTARLEKIQSEARAQSDRRLTETLAEMHERHAKTLKLIHARAIEALRDIPFDNPADAVKACDMVMRAEQRMSGEAAKRGEESIGDRMLDEMHRFLTMEPVVKPEPTLIEATVVQGDDDE